MTYNGQTNIRNGFLISHLVIGVVLHMCIPPKTIKVEFSSWPTVAILDLAVAKFVAGWRASSSGRKYRYFCDPSSRFRDTAVFNFKW